MTISLRPRRGYAPYTQQRAQFYPGSGIDILPGDLLFSPIGRKESRFVGHVGIVDTKKEVIHSVPAGIIKDSMERYFNKFNKITLFSPLDQSLGQQAAQYAEKLLYDYPKAAYRIWTPLGDRDGEQYCTKIVWQSYRYGAGVNLGQLTNKAKAVHPQRLKDRRYITRKKRF
ncbi:hypothetical protein [Halobacillus dabanensis]|uniref:hypothetical protein n=1 Tax=Halobacillus dabanensis TaxID=240302 RepID=UPI001428B861|nr:hypothetical protein [Halobacillus dabanensis]